ncbi:nuclear transport factor 2 family protein [Dokdonella fugitiva]|uniref:SnoaL-like protein n=1 Tax=Dokdonella fugitiva TaxID=328517 RepID=A0A4R2HUU0_9GAMM|nr:nuclear transport factor 2 family protein [Dokdonella fugitiva]TCO33785.1 SnoaL-like protein [Dokdonella fugitiva]
MTPLDSQDARAFAESWIEAWNRHDLDAVLSHFTDDLEFSSPLVSQFTGEATGRLRGKNAVRAYWQAGLSRLPDLHFDLVDVLVGVDCLTILYRGHRGLTAEVLTFGNDGYVVKGQAFYLA